MKTFDQFIEESGKNLPLHNHLSSEVDDLFRDNAGREGTISHRRNEHTGATKHRVGSVKNHALRTNADGVSKDFGDFIHHYGGPEAHESWKKSGTAILHTKEGHRHVLSVDHGTAHSVYTHQVNMKG